MTERIVKVQVPLYGGKSGVALIYSRGRKNMREQALDASTKEAIGTDAKAYFKAELVDGFWKIGQRVRDQDW